MNAAALFKLIFNTPNELLNSVELGGKITDMTVCMTELEIRSEIYILTFRTSQSTKQFQILSCENYTTS